MNARTRFAAALAAALCVSLAPQARAFSSSAALPAVLRRARPQSCSMNAGVPGEGRRGFLLGAAAAAFAVAGDVRGVSAATSCDVFPGCDVNGVKRVPTPKASPDALIQAGDPLPSGAAFPTDAQTRVVQEAIKAFDAKDLTRAESLFTEGIQTWESLQRPADERSELYKMRGNVRVDLKRFKEAETDYDRVLALMSNGEKPDGTARYMEYPDAFVQRGLAREGLADWQGAVADYSQAIKLWGGGRGEGINPFVMTYRANALARTGRYEEALPDYRAAERLFLQGRDEERALDARANAALALYQTGEVDSALRIMREIVRRRQGYTDMHVALAAVYWGQGQQGAAESEWEFACNNISTGCRQYKDMNWVVTVRRWPPALAKQLANFLGKA